MFSMEHWNIPIWRVFHVKYLGNQNKWIQCFDEFFADFKVGFHISIWRVFHVKSLRNQNNENSVFWPFWRIFSHSNLASFSTTENSMFSRIFHVKYLANQNKQWIQCFDEFSHISIWRVFQCSRQIFSKSKQTLNSMFWRIFYVKYLANQNKQWIHCFNEFSHISIWRVFHVKFLTNQNNWKFNVLTNFSRQIFSKSKQTKLNSVFWRIFRLKNFTFQYTL